MSQKLSPRARALPLNENSQTNCTCMTIESETEREQADSMQRSREAWCRLSGLAGLDCEVANLGSRGARDPGAV